MFKMRIIIPIAIIASVLSTFGVYKYLEKQKENIENTQVPYQTVMVANKTIRIGTKVKMDDLEVKEWPVDIVPGGAFPDTVGLIDRAVKMEIYQGEAMIESKLAPKGSEGGFTSIIPPGMRALTVSVNTYTGVSGFILPKTRVDVLVTVPSTSKKEESSTKIILEDVEVLAVDQTFERKGDDPVIVQSVTLLVKPEEAEKLALASIEGKLSLVLRNTTDRAKTATRGVRLKELISSPSSRRVYRPPTPTRRQPAAEPKQEPQPKVVEIIRSGERSKVEFDGKKNEKK
jgi:pilus assembly protein CpaB